MIPEISDIPYKYGNLALIFSCQSCTRTGLKHRSHHMLPQQTRCYYATSMLKTCPYGRLNKSLINVSEKTKHDLRKFNLLKVRNKDNQSRI